MSRQHATGWAILPEGGRPFAGVVALVVALAAGGLLVFAPRPATPQSAPPTNNDAPAAPAAPAELADVWPQAVVASQDDRLADGTQFTPRLYLDPTVAVGTAPTVDGDVRVMLRTSQETTELRRISRNQYPELGGFTTSGDTVLWAETTYPTGGDTVTLIWRLDLATRATTLVAEDDQAASYAGTQYDLIVVNETVYWVSTRYTNVTITELRSAPLDGGTVSVLRQELGTYALAAWPWLVTPYSGRGDPVRLLNMDTGEKILVPQNQGELAVCSATWCRVAVIADTGPVRIDLMRPNGTDRHRIAGADSSPTINDVALLDRFEVLTTYSVESEDRPSPPRLNLYDTLTKTTATLSVGVIYAVAAGGLLWWSTGNQRNYTWHVLDLRMLTR